ncbi:hypothetical protein CR513_01416, partial [Mucuna pruriens]
MEGPVVQKVTSPQPYRSCSRLVPGTKAGTCPNLEKLGKKLPDQYEYNMDTTLDRSQLQNMAKGETEVFKGYAQSWKELVAHIQPPLSENEMATMSNGTLYSLFYEKMVGNVASNFSDLVLIRERIEAGMRTWRIALEAATSHTNEPRDMEEEEEEEAT